MNNSTGKTFLLTLGVVVVLLLMGLLPTFSINDLESRPVKMLADLFPEEEEDSAAVAAPVVAEVKKPAPPKYRPAGVVLFDDFSEGKPGGMNHFWSKLLNAKKGGRINIAYFGDSFIESDILTCDLREVLQAKYGGSGPGWVDCGNGVGTNKPTISARFKNIKENCILKKPFDVNLEALNQRYYHASAGATMNLSATKYKPHVASWERATLFFATDAKLTVRTSGDSLTTGEHQFEPKGEIQILETKAHMTKLNYTFPNATTKTRLYGVALDGAKGVALDNYSMRGTPGFMLSKIPVKTMKEINKYRPYDLIILQFGLNVVNDKATDAQCRAYINRMKSVIEAFKQGFPQASIVVFSVPDRVQRSANGFHTLKGVEKLVGFQRVLASECGVGYLNVHEIMGGNDSMKKYVEEGLAAKDYTHLNYKGGKVLAEKIFQSMLAGVENYRREQGH
jgi:lysophospholipase L1-like esterase